MSTATREYNFINFKVLMIGNKNCEARGIDQLFETYTRQKIPEFIPVQYHNNCIVAFNEETNVNLSILTIHESTRLSDEDYTKLAENTLSETHCFVAVFSNKYSFDKLVNNYIPEFNNSLQKITKQQKRKPLFIFMSLMNATEKYFDKKIKDKRVDQINVELQEILEYKEKFKISEYLQCDLNNLENINFNIKKLAQICVKNYKQNISKLMFIDNLDLNISKSEQIIKYLNIENVKDLIVICKNYNETKYLKFNVFSKVYKDINLVYHVILKFLTMHVIKISLQNFDILVNEKSDTLPIILNYFLQIIKNFDKEFNNTIKFEINSNQLSKFLSPYFVKCENLMNNLLHLPFNIKCFEFLMKSNSFEKLIENVKIKNFEQINIFLDFNKPYIVNNKYIILEMIGEGAQGIVFKGFDLINYKEIAIKFITNFMYGFEKEIKLISKIGKHLNIIEYLDFDYFIKDKKNTTTSIPFIVMEKCNYSLSDKLKEEMSLELKLKLFLQICEGIEHLHLNNIIHRDIKPDNILIVNNNLNHYNNNNLNHYNNKNLNNNNLNDKNLINNEIVKLADFGTAKQQLKKGTITINVGTLHYIAPELFYEDKTYLETIKKEEQISLIDSSVDIYSLGCTLYLLITKRNLEYRFCKFYEMLKDEKKEKKLHAFLCDVIFVMLQNEEKYLIEILQRLVISMIQKNSFKRPKITIIIEILKRLLQNLQQQNLQKKEFSVEHLEALLPLKDFTEEMINEKDKTIQLLQNQLKEREMELCEMKQLVENLKVELAEKDKELLLNYNNATDTNK